MRMYVAWARVHVGRRSFFGQHPLFLQRDLVQLKNLAFDVNQVRNSYVPYCGLCGPHRGYAGAGGPRGSVVGCGAEHVCAR